MGDLAEDLREDIDAFVAEILQNYPPTIPAAPKVIHDPIWGTHQFYPHEIAVVDCPLLQRLRRIYQTGFSFFTFPSTTQTRFEHSLGSIVVATRMLEVVARRHPGRLDIDPERGDLAQIRMAALLHDCGHGFASHASEKLYQWHPAIQKVRATEEKFRDARASEILSWYIITSAAFREFLAQINNRCRTSLNPDHIADLVLGIPYDQRSFLAEVLNGPFDVDRVDYIVRDADYSEMKSGIDLERFFHDIDVSLLHDGRLHLVLHSTHAIEQLLWTKVHLFVRLYRHQKVLAADGAVQSLVSIVKSTGSRFNGADFSRVSDFLRTTDIDILGATTTQLSPEIATLIENLRHRRLPHRCLAVTPEAIASAGKPALTIQKLQLLNEDPDEMERLRREIWEAIPGERRPPLHSILLAFPPAPPLREASQVYILLRGQTEPRTLNSLFVIDEWLTTYNESHWAGYVFSNRDDIDVVTEAALNTLAQRGIMLDREISTSMRKPPMTGVAPALPTPAQPEEPLAEATPGLPVLETFVQRRLEQKLELPFKDLHALLILHFLSDLPPFLERLESLGLDPKKTWLIRKPYRYRFAQRIKELLRGKDYNVEECTAAEETEEPARRVLLQIRSSLEGDARFLVIEDGGYVTPMLHTDEFADLRKRCIGVVEQTTKGMRAIRGVKEGAGLRLPVVAVAESELKLRLEAGEVGDALAFTLENYFRQVLGTPLSRLPTLVIGFGPVGRNLASALAGRGARVSVFDSNYLLRIEATVHKPGGFNVLESLDDLSPFKLIVGTTANTSLDKDALLRTADGVILASGSSDRLEFDLAGLRDHVAQPLDDNVVLDGFITRYRLDNGRSIGVLCDGYPINFIIGDGIAKSVIDPILTELLAGATLIAERVFSQPGIHPLPPTLERDLWELYRKLTGY